MFDIGIWRLGILRLRDESLENLRNASLVLRGIGDEDISYTRGVICVYIKVKDDKVSFNLSLYGKTQISHPNAKLLSRAKTQLRKLIVCFRWTPTSPSIEKPSNEYLSIMDLSEAQKADWNRIPKREILRLNQQFQIAKEFNLGFLLDLVRSTLKRYEKSDVTKKTKSFIEKVKERLAS